MFGKFAADVVTQLLDFPHQAGSDDPAAVVNGVFKLGDTQFDPAGVITGWPFSTRCRGWDGFGRGQIAKIKLGVDTIINQQVILPRFSKDDEEPLYLGFFHTGAYQDAISGYGGIKHCLIPSPQHILIDRDEKGNFIDTLWRPEQRPNEMLHILGYDT